MDFKNERTAWKVSKYGPEKTSYLDTFHAVRQKKRKFEKSKEDDGDRSNQAQLKESTEDAEEMEM